MDKEKIILKETKIGRIEKEPFETATKTGLDVADEKAHEFKETLTVVMEDFMTTFCDIEIPKTTGPEIPNETVNIERMLDELGKKEVQLDSQKDAYIKLADKVANDLEQVKDFAKLKSVMVSVRQIYITLTQIEGERETLLKTYNEAMEKLDKVRMTESGFASKDEVRKEQDRLRNEGYKMRGRFFGFGRIFNSSAIGGVEDDEAKLEMLLRQSSSTKHYFDHKKYYLANLFEKIGISTIDLIDKICREFKTEQEKGIGKRDKPLSPDEVDNLDQEYIEKVVRKDLADSLLQQREYGSRKSIASSWGSKEDREHALDLIRQTYAFNMHRASWHEEADVEKQKRLLSEKIQNIEPYNLKSFIYGQIVAYCVDDMWRGFHVGVTNWTPVHIWQDRYRDMLNQTEKSIDRLGDHSLYNLKSQIKAKGWELRKSFDREDITNFDPKRWQVYKSNPKIRQDFGEVAINNFENEVVTELVEKLKSADRDEKVSIFAGKLFELGRKEAAPYLVLIAFRVGLDHGRYPFIEGGVQDTKDSVLCRYLESLPIDDPQLLSKPGLSDIVASVLAHKSTFNKKELVLDEAPGAIGDVLSLSPNPVYRAIASSLEDMSVHFLQNGTDEEKIFVLHTMKESNEPLGEQTKIVKKMLEGKLSYDVQKKIEDTLYQRFQFKGDIDALMVLIERGLLTEDQRFGVIKQISFHWEGYQGLQKKISEAQADTIANYLSEVILTRSKSETLENKFSAFLTAEHLGMSIKPSSDDIVELYEKKNLLSSNGNKEVQILSMAKGLTFTEEQGWRLANLIGEEALDNYSSDGWDVVSGFVEGLPVGDLLSVEDRAAIVGLLSKENINDLIKKAGDICTSDNWTALLSYYIRSEGGLVNFNEDNTKKLRDMFSTAHPENRDFCLDNIKKIWKEYLDSDGDKISIRGRLVSSSVRLAQGAGDLKYIEGIGSLMAALQGLNKKKGIAERTSVEIFKGLKAEEERFSKEGWSEDDKTAFYNISRNITEAAPSLYSNFLDIFSLMSPKEMKEFSRDYYPLYQANLVVLQNQEGKYNSRELVPIRNRLKTLKNTLEERGSEKSEVLLTEKNNLVKTLQGNIERRFGLRKIPEVVTLEHIRFMQNMSRYLANMSHRTPESDLLIGLYLGLNLNDDWDKFRAGQDVDLVSYFSEEKAKAILNILEKKKVLSEHAFDALGLNEKQLVAFKERLQEGTVAHMIGNVETIDMKLGNAKRNLDELADPDIYNEKSDREAILLLKENGKSVGATLAKTYMETTGKATKFSEDDRVIQARLKDIFEVGEWTPAKVKEIQDRIQSPNLILNLLKKLEDEKVEENIAKLQELIKPSPVVVKIFSSFGEEFKPNSGALALTQDLAYLENIIIKNDTKIGQDEREVLKDYLGAIRTQMVALESLYSKTKEYFQKIRKSSHGHTNTILKDRLNEIEKILNRTAEAVPIVTTVTSNLNLIIENMRQCLGCLHKEINNDTNLTFGDPNKFYLLSQGEGEKSSIADQLAFFLPSSGSDTENGMSFVMDNIYGSKSADVLMSHVNVMVKKYLTLKDEFPDANISILVTDAALRSVGLNYDQALEKISKLLKESKLSVSEAKGMNITVPESALGDNYIEFGGEARSIGERMVSCIKIV